MIKIWMKFIIASVVILLIYHCKEQKPVEEDLKVEVVDKKPVPKILIDLAEFGEYPVSEPEELRTLLTFKKVDSSGSVHEIDMETASKLCKQLMTSKRSVNYPIIEIHNTPKVVLMVQGRGYAGPIWAKLLLDTDIMELVKVEFQHSAESEGYGTPMTDSSFEVQFTGIDLVPELQTYGLRQNNLTILDGKPEINGISGATETGRSVVNMMNEGLRNYKTYLTQISRQ